MALSCCSDGRELPLPRMEQAALYGDRRHSAFLCSKVLVVPMPSLTRYVPGRNTARRVRSDCGGPSRREPGCGGSCGTLGVWHHHTELQSSALFCPSQGFLGPLDTRALVVVGVASWPPSRFSVLCCPGLWLPRKVTLLHPGTLSRARP